MTEVEKKMRDTLLKNESGCVESWEWNADNIKWLVKTADVTKKELSEATGIKEGTLTAYICGAVPPSLSSAVRLANYFQVPIDFLAGRCTEEESRQIFTNYEDYFSKLRDASYNVYLQNKYAGDDSLRSKTVFSWPYNLIESIYMTEGNADVEFDEDGLEEAISTLQPRETEAINLRFREELSLSSVATALGLSTERARQVIAKACRKLRHPARMKIIRYGSKNAEKMKELVERERAIQKKEEELYAREKRIEEAEKLVEPEKLERLKQSDERKPSLQIPIEEMDLSVRAYNALRRAGCVTVADVCERTESGKLLKTRNLGRKAAEEILGRLAKDYGRDYASMYGF